MPTMPLASLSPRPLTDTTPTTIPTVAHASATGMAFCALSTRIRNASRGPMRVSDRRQLVTTATTSAQKPAKSGERPSKRK